MGCSFPNHRGVAPLLWAIGSLACLEMLAVHLFVALKWPWIGWPLTVVSCLSIIWLVRWIMSWKRLPHVLADGQLTLHMGSLRSLTLALSEISRVGATVNDQIVKVKSCRKFVPVAYPNRVIWLAAPLQDRRQTDRIAIRLDDPAQFDACLAAEGVAVDD